MKIKKIRRLDKMVLDCPYIKTCGLKDSQILYSCRKGGYTDCSVYLINLESEMKELKDGKK